LEGRERRGERVRKRQIRHKPKKRKKKKKATKGGKKRGLPLQFSKENLKRERGRGGGKEFWGGRFMKISRGKIERGEFMWTTKDDSWKRPKGGKCANKERLQGKLVNQEKKKLESAGSGKDS